MPQTYKKKEGGRQYGIHDPNKVKKALNAVKAGVSISCASRRYGIPFSTLRDKLNVSHVKKHGGQTALSSTEEGVIAAAINELAEWGFPITKDDIRQIVKNYLNKMRKSSKVFKENCPGKDYVNGFMKRNKLTQRTARNMSKTRASVAEKHISEFFENIKAKLQSVQPFNIFNFDETNVTDDPGSRKVVVFRGKNRVERLMEHSKVATSLMFCISAVGEILPPYVVYKAENLYENWCTGGPRGAKYGVSKSGWFDSQHFEAWFTTIFLPFVQNREGDKIIIGDNLASHFSPTVVDLCLKHNIYFTTIPPNSTHLMQPLDVAFFRPLKTYWRNILESWRKESRKSGTIPKEAFPILLRKLYEKLETTGTQNAKSGFKKTGLHPFNPQEVISMLPGTLKGQSREQCTEVLNESVLEFLREQRSSSSATFRRGRGKKIIPGRPIIPATSDTDLKDKYELREANDNLCSMCKCKYTYCTKWICGFCNNGRKDPRFICEECLDED